MKALLLTSGMGWRMGAMTREHPKCMTELPGGETILSRQLRLLSEAGVREIVMTTGAMADTLTAYCDTLPTRPILAHNPLYAETNYIYSMRLAAETLGDTDLLLLHGDLAFSPLALLELTQRRESGVIVSSTLPLPEKDFKAKLGPNGVEEIGVSVFERAVAAQPLYYLTAADWRAWRGRIAEYCARGERGCYAENALNELLGREIRLRPVDMRDELCAEIDTPEDWARVGDALRALGSRTVYMSFSADILHSGHMRIIRRAASLGQLTIGVLSDAAVAGYKRYPLLQDTERMALMENIGCVSRVVRQDTLSYAGVLRALKPDIVVHGDDWRQGFQKPVRDEVVRLLAEYGGYLAEFPYSTDAAYDALERGARMQLSIPELRRARLRRLLAMKPLVTAMEAHDGLTGLIVEKTVVHENGGARQFDAMWVSSLCDSTAKGKPDIELVDMSSRLQTIDQIMEVTTKPIILDGDTGGLTEHFVYNVRTLERMGVSAVIIEDKTGLKKNSLFGAEVAQTQESVEAFSAKIRAGKAAQRTRDFMIIARIESLILERGMDDALMRAEAFTRAGADGVMIHSRRQEPDEIFEFVRRFRERDAHTPLIVVPTSFNQVTEEEFAQRGVNVVIYANQLIRSAFPAMRDTAETILRCHRAQEADARLLGIKEILTLIPEE